ncbi:uncharacterized protein Z519_11635 [Cladophialophora bantiana CBS 173.52]|uniref:aldehyde dehydrogenase (NAD(+)) n=1 Tax=Cladophialophora bantiana (strain ATCC 10958 / CBS 173.52 / CDC B-1940 / NIH 8579) TaxID=1442370 RepID=A0A0D2EC24_CLAB1|nr:uncharacterized protein Z519_11635 [Cladophialophora bantiana CBS 173.52]KIW87661.1 hypothetical protein Z519_11635 [Cladophialophora bantiana CBS 173.52]
MKRVTLELGGKSPAIVFSDAPLEAAVGGVGQGFLVNSGQICVAASRVLVQEDIAPKSEEALKQQFESVSAGMGPNPLEPTTMHGPVVDKDPDDAQLLTVWNEEIFGPVMSVKTFKTEEEAIELVHESTYGLTSPIYATSLTRGLRVASALETGGVSINSLFVPEIQSPFGGVKQSGTGRELGKEGLKVYLEPKQINIK